MGCSKPPEPEIVEGVSAPSQPQALPALPVESQETAPLTPIEYPGEGTWVIGMEANFQTILMSLGEQFDLRLKDGYIWEVGIDDPSVINRIDPASENNVTQGTYQAFTPGETVLRASGDPPCRRETPACMMPSLLFEVNIQVFQP